MKKSIKLILFVEFEANLLDVNFTLPFTTSISSNISIIRHL